MRFSRASVYALYGLSYIAGQPDGKFVPLSEIRGRYGVPVKHLAKIFQTLVRAGYLRSARGVHGGFALSSPAERVSLLQIIEAIDGPFASEECPFRLAPCHEQKACVLACFWADVRGRMVADLQRTTLAQLATRAAPHLLS